MPRLDSCHTQVLNALIKDGWDVKSSQFFRFDKRTIFIDMVAFKQDEAQTDFLFIEVKCFPDRDNLIPELHTAIGQYLDYANLLQLAGYTIPLYLVIPLAVFRRLDDAMQHLFEEHHIHIVVIDISYQEVVRWIRWQ
jgi:hypothetical protein